MEKQRNISNIVSIVKGMASLPLFIEKQQAQNLLMRYDAMYQSGAFEGMIAAKENPIQVAFYSASTNVSYGKFAADFTKIEKGSIAVVPVMGAMMRDSYCTFSDGFVSGTRDLEATLKALDENENVDGIVFYINSPGGQADGNESLSRVIASTKTPTVGFFEGMASAAVYAFQGVKELYAAETQSYWGSIGTYISIVDDREFWEKMGVNYMEIYAPQSTEKNKEFRGVMDGDLEPMKQMLSTLTDAFIKSVKKSRPSLQDDGHVFKGKLYSAADAMKIGAIDGIKNLEFAIDRARILGKKAKKQNVNTNQNIETMSFENEKKLSLWEKFWGASTASEVETDMQKLESSTKELQTKYEALEKELATAKNENQGFKSSLELATEKMENYKKLAMAEQSSKLELENALNAQNETIKATGFENIESLLEDHAKLIQHNKELGGAGSTQTPINEQQTVSAVSDNKPLTYEDTAAKTKAALDSKKKAK